MNRLTCIQAVKYIGTGPAIPDLDDAGEAREGSDVDEDFISNESSDDDSDKDNGSRLSSPRNLGKGGKRKPASKTRTPKTPRIPSTLRKQANTTNTTQSTPSRRGARRGATTCSNPRMASTPSKPQAFRKQSPRSAKNANKTRSQEHNPAPQSSSQDLAGALGSTRKCLGETNGVTTARATPQDPAQPPARTPVHIHEQEDRPAAHSPTLPSPAQDQLATARAHIQSRISPSPDLTGPTISILQTPSLILDKAQLSPSDTLGTSPPIAAAEVESEGSL